MFSDGQREIWNELRRKEVLGDRSKINVAEGPGYFYRPHQLLVNTEDVPLIAEDLKRVRAIEQPEVTAQFTQYDIPITVFTVVGVSIPALVSRLRSVRDDGSPVPRVGPNHVFGGEPHYQAGPGGEPSPSDPIEGRWGSVESDAQTVAALDTGIPGDLATVHPELFDRIVTEGDDVDPLYSSGDLLEHDAGHGTFVAGIIMQLAPWLRIDPEKVLDRTGLGDDAMITLGMAKANCTLVNASLGGYTHDDMPPVAFEAFLAKRDPESVLVAAAGNNNQGRPFWPAAFKHVIAVGAVDNRNGSLTKAPFSNFGDWVDCCAPGVEIRSTYVTGEWQLVETGNLEQLKGWACWSGTSFAAPHVTAAIAARMNGTGLTPRQAAHAVLAEATEHVPGLGFFIKPEYDLNCQNC